MSKRQFFNAKPGKNNQAKKSKQSQVSRTNAFHQKGFALIGKQLLPIIVVVIVAVLAAAVILYRQSTETSITSVSRPALTGQFGLKAVKTDAAGLDPATSFILSSSKPLANGVIEEIVKFTPEVKFKVKKLKEESSRGNFFKRVFAQDNSNSPSEAASAYELKPEESLNSDTNYKVSISDTKYADRQYDWAFPVKAKFQVLESHPRDHGASVPTNSTIEFKMNREKFIEPEKYFTISPEAAVTTEQRGTTLIYKTQGLAEKTLYTAVLKKGLKVEGCDDVLEQDFTFTSETGEENYQSGQPYFYLNGDFLEFLPDKQPYFEVSYYNYEPSNLTANLYKFDKPEEFLSSYQDSRDWDYRWTSYFWNERGSQYEPDPEQLILTFPINVIQVDYKKFFEVPQSLQAGYYFLDFEAAGKRHQAWMQITPVAHYYSVTSKNSLIWLYDFPTRQALQNNEVSFVDQASGEIKLGDTDSNGLLEFATPEALTKDVYDSPTPKFYKVPVGSQPVYVRISDGGNYRSEAPAGDAYWDYLSLERMVYKMSDTMRFWGVVKGRQEDLREKKVTIAVTNSYYYYFEGWYGGFNPGDLPTALITQEAVISPFDTIQGEMSFTGLTPGMYNLEVRYGDQVISTASFEVMTYLKPAYQISVTPSRRSLFAGEAVDFNVEAKFFDGTPVPNQTLKYSGWWNSQVEGEITLDSDGRGVFSYTPEYINDTYYMSYPRSLEFTFRPNLAEEGDIYGTGSVMVFGPKYYLESKTASLENHQYQLTAKLNKIVLSDKVSSNYGEYSASEYIGDPVPNYALKAKVIKTTTEKREVGEYYDPINRVTQKTYDYTPKEETVEEVEGKTDADGEWEIIRTFVPEAGVYYRVVFSGSDEGGRGFEDTEYIYSGYSVPSGKQFAISLELNSTSAENSYSIGDPVKAEVKITQGELPANAQTLFYRYQNKIDRTAVKLELILEEKFEESFAPSVQYRAVILGPTGFEETQDVTASYRESDKALTIEVNPDKSGYRPGEKVTLSVVVKDKDSQPVSAQVNLAAVDEALFHIVPYTWQPKILETLYRNIYLWPISAGSDYALMEGGAERGGCFGAGTKVLLADGQSKPIEAITVGDRIMAGAGDSFGALKPAVVQGVSSHFVNEYMVVNGSLVVTPEHPLYVNGKWQPAGNLKLGDSLLTKDGTSQLITSVETIKDKAILVYNLVVGTYHTYFADGILAHNAEKGGGLRSKFADVALYQTVQTDQTGQGSATFTAPDNITSWKVTALAYAPEKMMAGQTAKLVPVSLPIFADSTLNSVYRKDDEPTVRVRAFGNEYQTGQPTEFTLKSVSLGLDLKETSSERQVKFQLNALPAGDHDLTLGVKQGDKQDSLKRTVKVIENHFQMAQAKEYAVSEGLKDIEGNASAFTHLVFSEAGLGKYFSPLISLTYQGGTRSDQTASAYLADRLLAKYFKYPEPEDQLDLSNYIVSSGGLALFPYSDTDLELSAKLADLATDYVYKEQLVSYFTSSLSDEKADQSRVSQALYGLASLGEPVLAKINTILQSKDLTLENRTYLALGLIRLGDKENARLVYQEKIKTALRFEGGEAWLDGESDITRRVKLTGLVGVLTAELNITEDAKAVWGYISGHYPESDLDVLERTLMLRALLANANQAPVSFKLQTDSRTETVKLENGDVYTLDLSAEELASIKFSEVKGDTTLVSWFERSKNTDELQTNPDLKLSRSYLVDNHSTTTFSEGDIVLVRLDPNIASSAIDGTYQVVDYLPSGLRPITQLYNRNLTTEEVCNPLWYPTKIVDQAAYFTIYKDFDKTDKCTNRTINYYARVVSPGSYSAESAVIQSLKNLNSLNLSEVQTVEIK
ncbi:MAG: polymorphic toxin-type HINT domain-containing protein [Patescibacteria group bacterium]|nr:polymorphic toxin-type HINT domain-containing protein [Patescibacteria group bacterium]